MKYSSELIQAIALWQNGWREKPELKEELTSTLITFKDQIPPEAKIKPDFCYRVLLLGKKEIFALFLQNELPETFSSWTMEKEFAQIFKRHLGDGQIGFVFKYAPSQEEIFLNIPAMWDDSNFIQDLELHKQSGIQFHKALEHFRGEHDQKEIILNSCQIRFEDIVSFSGRSSFEGLCEVAGAISEEDQEKLSKLLVMHDHYAEDTVCWLSELGTWRVLDRVITKLEEILNRHKQFAQKNDT